MQKGQRLKEFPTEKQLNIRLDLRDWKRLKSKAWDKQTSMASIVRTALHTLAIIGPDADGK